AVVGTASAQQRQSSRPAPRSAWGPSQVRELRIAQDGARTVVTIAVAASPTFTVFKLERPTRVVIDVANAQLAPSADGSALGSTWAVGQVAATQVTDDAQTAARVVITLRRPGDYDVKARGNDIVVTVTAFEAPPAEKAQPLAAGADKREVEAARAEAQRARAEADKLRQQLEQQKTSADKALAEALARKKQADDALAQSSGKSKAEIDAARAEAEKAGAAAQARAKEANAARQEIDRLKAEVARLQASQTKPASQTKEVQSE